MDEDERKLDKLIKNIKQKDDPSFWEIIQSLWYVNIVVIKKQNHLNALRWLIFQDKIEKFIARLLHKQ